jgi:4-hydroxybenzoate polyprenyltransferase
MSDIRTLASQIPFWIQVTRLDRPVGWIVLLWPTWIALTLAGFSAGRFELDTWIIFTLGVIVTRSAGCVINDLTDRKFDKHVKRTKTRPITTGNLPVKDAVILALVLLLIAFGLALQTNSETVYLSFVALGLAVLYPWLKRITFWPQIGLGLAFSMAIPMAFAAYDQPLDRIVWLLFAGNVAWTLAYDTFYAMVDRDDDLLIGVKSTAIAFGRFDLIAIGCCQAIALFAFAYAFWLANLNPFVIFGVIGAAGFAIRHQWIAKSRARDACFRAFLENHRFGAALFIGAILGVL